MVLAGSLNYEQTLAHVVDLVVPEIADWCGVYIADTGDGEEREITSRHADPELEAMLLDIRRRRRDGEGGSESLQGLRTGRAGPLAGGPRPAGRGVDARPPAKR